MHKSLRLMALFVLVICSLSACTKGRETPNSPPVSSADKELSCEQIKLEINDAEYLRMKAKENRGLRAGNILWPFGYPATYISSAEAIESANERIRYLQQVYRIKQCGHALYERL